MTVDEAKNKVCPMIFFEGDCIGPECMAWRWHYEDTFIGETYVETLMSKTDGYCGLAGKEGAE